MAGIWDIVENPTGETERINVSAVHTEILAVGLTVHDKATALSKLESVLGRDLTGDAGTVGTEKGDLNAIADAISSGTVEDRLVYAAKLHSMLNAAELSLTDEAEFRTTLGITV